MVQVPDKPNGGDKEMQDVRTQILLDELEAIEASAGEPGDRTLYAVVLLVIWVIGGVATGWTLTDPLMLIVYCLTGLGVLLAYKRARAVRERTDRVLSRQEHSRVTNGDRPADEACMDASWRGTGKHPLNPHTSPPAE